MVRQLILTVLLVSTATVVAVWTVSRESTQGARLPNTPPRNSIVVEGTGEVPLNGTQPVATVRLNAERAAKLDALDRLIVEVSVLELANDSGDIVAKVAEKQAIEDAARRFRVIDTKYYSDGSVDIVAELPLDVVDELVAPAVVRR